MTTIILSIGIFLIILYFIFNLGIRVLLSTAAFIANLRNKATETSLRKNSDVYALINIDSIPTATNSAKILITGSVLNFDQVEFYLNEEKIKEINLYSSDSFSEEIGDLLEGENEIYVKGKTKDNKISKQSKKFLVIYKKNKPKLEIDEPADQTKTSQPEIRIKGKTDKEVFIKINDSPVVVDALGNFETNIRLKEGENIITVIAEDQAGNYEKKVITATYQL